tara:strand:- start:332 stop:1174 length:843 start_codon:yes stop_codon:yes gene_type:complete
MKWLGQLIYDQIARFRDDVYLEDISTGTIASGGNLGLDSNNKVVKANVGGVTSIVAGDGIDVSGATGDVTITAETADVNNPGVVELATDAEAIAGSLSDKAVTPANLKARVSQIVNIKGYSDLESGKFKMANHFSTDDEAPFQFGFDAGLVTSSVDQKYFWRGAGFHVPFACTVSDLQVQASVSGTGGGNVTVALVEYQPHVSNTSMTAATIYEQVNVTALNHANKVGTTNGSLSGPVDASGSAASLAVAAGSHLMLMIAGDASTAGDTAIVSASIGLSW